MENKDNTALEWKSHNEYFEVYSMIKQQYNSIYSSCIMDLSKIPATFAKLFEFVGHIKGQLLLKMDSKEIKENRNRILDLIAKGKKLEALEQMDIFYSEIIGYCSMLELEPKPEEKPIDEIRTEKDDKIRAALIAYELIYEK